MTLRAEADVTPWAPFNDALFAIQGAKGRAAPVGIFMVGSLSLERWGFCGDLLRGVMPGESTRHWKHQAPERLARRELLLYEDRLAARRRLVSKYRAKGSLWGSGVTVRMKAMGKLEGHMGDAS